MKKLLSIILLSTIGISSATNPPKNKIENKISGTLMIEPSEFNFPAFPKATFYNKKDTITYQGNHMGQITYSLPEGKYNILIEPGRDSIQNLEGEKFKPYKKQMEITSKKNY